TLDEAWERFGDCDIVLCSTAAPHAVVTWDRVAPAIGRRGGRPLCILDLAVPRDVEPAVAQLENVFLYDLDDLQAVAAQAAAERAGRVERTLRRLSHLSPEDRAQIEYFSQALLNKFLHQPTVALKAAARAGRGYGLLDALKRLFGLERRDGT